MVGLLGVLLATDGMEQDGFLWQDGRMTDLGALTDSTYSAASAINDRGQILGFRFKDFQFRTVLWEAR